MGRFQATDFRLWVLVPTLGPVGPDEAHRLHSDQLIISQALRVGNASFAALRRGMTPGAVPRDADGWTYLRGVGAGRQLRTSPENDSAPDTRRGHVGNVPHEGSRPAGQFG